MKKNIRNELLELIDTERISKKNIDEVLKVSQIYAQPYEFLTFLKMLLIWIGAISLVLALLFFMAFNWSELGRISKFIMIEVAMGSTIVLYLLLDDYRFLQQVLLTLSSIILGLFLALIGQTYQTGADPWQLFALWAFFMTPWAVVVGFSALWLLWILLINLSMILYHQQFNLSIAMMFELQESLLLMIFIFNSLLWGVWNFLAKKYFAFQNEFIIQTLALLSFSAITTLTILNLYSDINSTEIWIFLIYILFLSSVYYIYRVKKIDIYMMSLYALSLFLLTFNLVIRFFVSIHLSDFPALITLLIVIMGLTTLMVSWLKYLKKEL